MCGICGIINLDNSPIDAEIIKQMMKKMKHRGPDDEGYFIRNSIGLGHVRLSIIDLSSAGHQPMESDDGRYLITYNGEIYNYIELRAELQDNFIFRTQTDTEVLLNAYRKWGAECLNHLNGMFAFVVYDKITNDIFGARDRFGIKPLYYMYDDKVFLFASDIPPILQASKQKLRPNDKIISEYLLYGRTDQSEETFYQDIKKLQHGHYFTLSGNKFKLDTWYQLNQKLSTRDEDISVDYFFYLLQDSIKLRLRSDVPLGVCLSGGLDSSSLVAILKRKLDYSHLETFSAIYSKDERADESTYINSLESYINRMHFISPNADSFFDDLPSLFNAHSEPFSTTAIYAQFKVMQLAKDHVIVLLDGQGADEYLAGYHYFYGFYFKELLRTASLVKLLYEIYFCIKNTGSLLGLGSAFYYFLPSHFTERAVKFNKDHLSKDFINQYSGSNIVYSLYKSKDLNTALLNHFEYKLEHLLKWEDRNSMYFSIESRVPFLDYRLVEYVISLPSSAKIKKGVTKSLLRSALGSTLPPVIANRKDKIGFATPEARWLRNSKFISLFKDIIIDMRANDSGYFNAQKCEKLFNDFLLKKNSHSADIWKIINLHYWIRNYIR